MKCLTVWNPWAAAIVIGDKDVENRPWRAPASAEGRRFYVHAGKQYDDGAEGAGIRWARRKVHGLPLGVVRGAVIGSVELVGCAEAEDCQLPWCMGVPGAWAWLLRDPRVFRRQVPMRGALGLFEPAAEVAEALEREEAEAVGQAAWWRWWQAAELRRGMDAAEERGEGLGRLD